MSDGNNSDCSGMTRREFESKLIARAWKDEAFKKRLLENPKRVFEDELGVKLPDGLQIKILEETGGQLYLVLPPNPEHEPDLDLSDEQLEMVTGGSGLPVFLLSLLSPPKQ
jgi:hypothetical protein